ncbi:beta glucosidase 15 [Actinidia rufa]|uniref:Beta glucosidase 15 n=1 Tax=Actinidia rufa TaxID=165716 RepID=A0A7J0H533_9ERIC|nr:beta glucosidase 15 [Actinidia rufa]
MRTEVHLLLRVLVVVNTVVFSSEALSLNYGIGSLNRSSFPAGFIFGAASAAYQVEGGANEGGKGPSIWDTYTHKYPGKIADHSNGDVALDAYHRYKEDVGIIRDMGLDAYRFSISWPRILPRGNLSGGVNQEGIRYYNNLINELVANDIEPFVTLFHWDLPQALEDEYGGFLSPQVVVDFRDYADLCFREFGDRVKYWITLNEPWSFSSGGYDFGLLAPGRCSSWLQRNCTGGDSGIEPYLVAHNQLLAHAAVSRLYKQNYQASQKGKIGITLETRWMVPLSNATQDQNAVLRALDFRFGWFMDPLTTGDYPRTMRSLVTSRLPKFTREQSRMVNGSFDFLGLNYYTAEYAAHAPNSSNGVNMSYSTDSQVYQTTYRNGIPIGEKAASDWLYIYPRGIWDLLLHIKRNYNNPVIYITENGVDEVNNATLSLDDALVDNQRINYYHDHLSFLRRAIEDKVNVKGFLAWSLMDNFEWALGYTVRFGLTFVDYNDRLKRYPKLSARWYKNFLQK